MGMTPLRQANSFSQLFGFNPLSRPYYPSSSERFIKLGDTDDQKEQSHDDNNHSTTTKHKITQNMLDRLTGKSGLKTTKTTDIVSDDGHSQVHMVVSSFDMDGEENKNEKQAEKEEIEMGNKEYSVEAEKIFNGKIRPGKTYGFSVEDLKEREFERQKYVDNMIGRWHTLLNGPFPGNEETSDNLNELENIMKQKQELEEKIKQLNNDEKLIKDKMIEQEKVENAADSEIELEPEVVDVVPAEDHVTFVSSDDEKDLEDNKEDVEAEDVEAEDVEAENVVEDKEETHEIEKVEE